MKQEYYVEASIDGSLPITYRHRTETTDLIEAKNEAKRAIARDAREAGHPKVWANWVDILVFEVV